MNNGAERRLVSNQFTVGVDAPVAAAPVGRTTSAQIRRLYYGGGVFVGVALQGATLKQDLDTKSRHLRERADEFADRTGEVRPPRVAQPLIAVLNKYVHQAEARAR